MLISKFRKLEKNKDFGKKEETSSFFKPLLSIDICYNVIYKQ